MSANFAMHCEIEADGRWVAEVRELPGVMVYGESRGEAILSAQTLALRVIAERLERREIEPATIHITLPDVA